MEQIVHRVLRFDRFILDLTRGSVRVADQELVLRPKAFEVLHYLAENAGRLVSKRELHEAVWPKIAVTDNSLEQCVRELRETLGDADHVLIKTLPRRGYLLDSAVETSTLPNGVAVSRGDGTPSSSAVPPRLSIVVLPFQNLSGNPDQEYFSDCVTEDLTTDLSRLAGVMVIARSTAFTYKGRQIDVRQVGQELGVRYVLEGTVRRSTDRIRVTAQLVDAITGVNIWGDRFDVAADSLAELDNEVTGRIACALNTELVLAESRRSSPNGAGELEAEDLIFRGRALFNKLTSEDTVRARRLFELALELNGQSADGFAYLAQTYVWEWLFGWTTDMEAALGLAEQNVRRAIAIEPRHVDALWNQGVLHDQRREFDRAIAAFDTALAQDPNFARAYARRSYGKCLSGQAEDALADVDHALRLNPRGPHLPVWYWYTGLSHHWLHRHDQALAWFVRSVDADRRAHVFYPYLAAEYVLNGRRDEARTVVAEYHRLLPSASIESLRKRWGYRSEHPRYLEMMEAQLEALQRAGLPSE